MNKSRRSVLTTTSTIVAAMLASASSRAANGDWFGRKDTIEILQGEFKHLNSFNKIGRRYLDIKGGYITIEELNANLNSRIYNDVEIDKYNGLNTRQKKTIISKIIKKDFESGNIIDVDGWVLSNTEVNICAILCLVKSHSES